MKHNAFQSKFKVVVLFVDNMMSINLNKLEVVDALVEMKKKVIKDFDHFVRRMNKGYVDKYDMILHDISFIQSYQAIEKRDRIYEFLMNN